MNARGEVDDERWTRESANSNTVFLSMQSVGKAKWYVHPSKLHLIISSDKTEKEEKKESEESVSSGNAW